PPDPQDAPRRRGRPGGGTAPAGRRSPAAEAGRGGRALRAAAEPGRAPASRPHLADAGAGRARPAAEPGGPGAAAVPAGAPRPLATAGRAAAGPLEPRRRRVLDA